MIALPKRICFGSRHLKYHIIRDIDVHVFGLVLAVSRPLPAKCPEFSRGGSCCAQRILRRMLSFGLFFGNVWCVPSPGKRDVQFAPPSEVLRYEACWAKTTADDQPGITVRDHCLNRRREIRRGQRRVGARSQAPEDLVAELAQLLAGTADSPQQPAHGARHQAGDRWHHGRHDLGARR